jgi:hypothetical protein
VELTQLGGCSAGRCGRRQCRWNGHRPNNPRTVRWTPVRTARKPADEHTSNCSDRTGDHQTSTGASQSADKISTRR